MFILVRARPSHTLFGAGETLWLGGLRHPLQPERSYLIEASKAPEKLNNAERLSQPGCSEAVRVI